MSIKFFVDTGLIRLDFEASTLKDAAAMLSDTSALETIAKALSILSPFSSPPHYAMGNVACNSSGTTDKLASALSHVLSVDADKTAVDPDNARRDADEKSPEYDTPGVTVEPRGEVGQGIQTGEEREDTEEGDGTDGKPGKRKRRTKAEMEAAREAERAAKANAGNIPPLPAATPENPVTAVTLPPAQNPVAAVPPPPVAAPAPLPLPPAPALPPAPKPPALLAGRVIDAIQQHVDEGRTPESMVQWLHAYSIVNTADASYESAQATIRLMSDEKLMKVAEALGCLDD